MTSPGLRWRRRWMTSSHALEPCATRRGSEPRACRPEPSIPTSGVGIRRSPRSAARGTTSHARSRSSRRYSAHSGRTGWCLTSSSTRRWVRTPTFLAPPSGSRRPARPHAPRDVETSGITQPTDPRACGARDAPSRAGCRTRRSRVLRWLYPRARSPQHAVHARCPTTSGTRPRGHRFIRGSPGSTTRLRGTAPLIGLVIPPGGVPPYERRDLAHGDPKDRPTNEALRPVRLSRRPVPRFRLPTMSRLVDVAPFLIAGPMFNGIAASGRCRRWRRSHRSSARSPTPHLEDAEEVHATRCIDELWDGTTGRMQRARGAPEARRTVEGTIVCLRTDCLDPHLSTEVVDAHRAEISRSASFHPGPAGRHVVPSFDAEGCGLRRTSVLARSRLDQYDELDAVDGSCRQHGHATLAEEIAAEQPWAGSRRSGFHRVLRPLRRTSVRDRRVRLDGGADHRPHRAARRRRAERD